MVLKQNPKRIGRADVVDARARRRAADLERRCQAAAERLAREDVVWDAAAGAPALGLSVALYAGRLRLAGQVEALTANLIAINRRYKAHSSLKVTDLP